MARKKKYIEEEVIEKAMALFWRNGYNTTSMQMLENELSINKFSIYSSFGSKSGVFIHCIHCYKHHLRHLTDKLKKSVNGIVGIKQYFYDFLVFSRDKDLGKGCFITNAAIELGPDADPKIKAELVKFTNELKLLFAFNLNQESDTDKAGLTKQNDSLIIAFWGLSSASRTFSKTQLTNYIESTFRNL